MLKPDRFSCSQKIWLKRDPPVLDVMAVMLGFIWLHKNYTKEIKGDREKVNWYCTLCIKYK